jgi:dTDP-4-dehydrorhamnose 3,5-epimerase
MEVEINDVYIRELKVISDKRGSILKMLNSGYGIIKSGGEFYFSELNVGHIKAWKKHSIQKQHLCVPFGSVQLVLIDDRSSSSSFKKRISIQLSRDISFLLVFIPPGIIYGFKNVGANTALIANYTDISHDPSEGIVYPETEFEF